MSSPKYRWWGYTCRMVRDYPEIKEAYEDLHDMAITARASGTPGGGDGRTLERIAMRQLPGEDQKIYDAVQLAIKQTVLLKNGYDVLRMIKFCYWEEKHHKLEDAALYVNISPDTAKSWHGAFIRRVASAYGFSLETYAHRSE